MSPDTAYTLVNAAVLPFWLLLLVAPHARPTNLLVHSGVIPVAYGLIYIYYLLTAMFAGGAEGGGMGTLEGLQIALSDPHGLVGAWVHYLVFDLFVGAWIVRDARRLGIHHLATVIPLLLTFMAGPFGLLLYIVIRGAWKSRFLFDEANKEPTIG